MKHFLKKKFEIIRQESEVKNMPVWKWTVIKLSGYSIQMLLSFLDHIILILMSPFVLLSLLLFKLSGIQMKPYAFFVGLEHVIQKTLNRSVILEKHGYQIIYFSMDNQKKTMNESVRIFKYRNFSSFNLIILLIQIFNHKPSYIEVYTEGNLNNQLTTLLVANILGIYAVVIERGFLFMYEGNFFSALFKRKLKLLYQLSNSIYYRETYMPELFAKLGIPSHKLVYDFNRVPIKPLQLEPKDNVVLFLNGFKDWRNLHLLIQAMPSVIAKQPDVFFQIVGAADDRLVEYYKNQCVALGIDQSKYDIQCWTNQPDQFYEKAKIFVLPADLIFCNFSLLEAMERGLVPIVANVEDADKIVQHQYNGILCERNSEQISLEILHLLSDPDTCEKMSVNARQSIIEHYNDFNRMDSILENIKLHFNS